MWDKLDRGQKLVAAILGIGSLGGGISTGIMMLSRTAAASVVAPVERRVTRLEDQHEGEVEWRRYVIQRLDHIAGAVGAQPAPPVPESAINPLKDSH